MHGKAQLEPAQHSIVLDCKLVPLHNTCRAVRLAIFQCENLVGGQKLVNRSQPLLVQSSWNLGVGGKKRVPVDRQVFSNCWYHVPLQIHVWSKFKVDPKNVFCPSLWGVLMPGEFGPKFLNSSHNWIMHTRLVENRSVTPEIGVYKRKKGETTAVKYKPFGIAMPCGLKWKCSKVD